MKIIIILLLVFTSGVVMAEEPVDAVAQYRLGFNYYFGIGVERDYQEALKWFRKAAKQGHAGAQYELGFIYDKGQGVQLLIDPSQ